MSNSLQVCTTPKENLSITHTSQVLLKPLPVWDPMLMSCEEADRDNAPNINITPQVQGVVLHSNTSRSPSLLASQ